MTTAKMGENSGAAAQVKNSKVAFKELLTQCAWSEIEDDAGNRVLRTSQITHVQALLKNTDLNSILNERNGAYWSTEDEGCLMRFLNSTDVNIILFLDETGKAPTTAGDFHLLNPEVTDDSPPYTGRFLFDPEEHLLISLI
jgi:hypothetical protein